MINYLRVTCLFGVVAGALSFSSNDLVRDEIYSNKNYGFNYAVNDSHTDDYKPQTEVREGDFVKVPYSLAEPGGTTRIVDYTADPVSGFNAIVKRVGLEAHPQQLLTPVITKVVAAPVLATAPLLALGNIGYSDPESCWDHGLDWGDHGGHEY